MHNNWQMKSLFNSLKAHVFLFSLVVFTIPLKHNYNSISVILLVIFTVGHFYHNKDSVKFEFKKGKPLILFYGCALLAMIYTNNIGEGLKHIQKLLPFLIFPVVFSIIKFNEKNRNRIIWWFCISCLIISIFLFTSNLFVYLDSPNNTNVWYYSGYTKMLDIHPAYFILFLIFNVFFLFEELLKAITIKKKIFTSFFIFIFILQILFLQSRVGIVSFLITLFVYFLITKKTNKKYLFLTFTFVIISLFIAYQYEFLKRFAEIPESMNERIMIWKGWWSSYKENPIFGYGTGDAQNALDYGNYLLGNDFFISYKYNTHNQYLDTLIRYGLIGFSFFIFIFYNLHKGIFKNRNKLLLIFSILICFFFLTENVLQKQRGIVFFSFFYMLLNNPNIDEE